MINGGCHDGGFSENILFVLMEIMVDTEILILGHCSKLKIHDSRILMNDDTISAYLHSYVYRTPGAGTFSERKISAKLLVKITIIFCRGQGNRTITIEVYFLPWRLKLNCFKGSLFLPWIFEWSGQQARWLIYASKSCRKSCPTNLNLYLSPGLYMSQLLVLGKLGYGWRPIFKVVLKC